MDLQILNGDGYVFQNLLSNCIGAGILAYVAFAFVYPSVNHILTSRKLAKYVDGPKGHWFWGDIKTYGFNHDGLLNSIKRCEKYPAMCTYYIGPQMVIQLYHPDVTKTAFTRLGSKGFAYSKMVKAVLGEGLVTSEGALWKRHRRLLTAIFHFDILKEHCLIFNKNCKLLKQNFDRITISGKPGDVTTALSSIAFANMMECVMSQIIQNNSSEKSPFIAIVNDLTYLIMERQQNFFYWIDSIYYRTKSGKRLIEIRNSMLDEANRIINERQALLNSLDDSDLQTATTKIKDEVTGKVHSFRKRKGKVMDFLDVLLQAKDQEGVGLTQKEIADEVITFFAAGMETVATGLTWALYLLAKNPSCQTKCRNEIMEEIGNKENIEMSDFNKLSYLNQVVKEVLRMYPPVHNVGRTLNEDIVFSHRFNNYKPITLKKGTYVGVNIFATHRNPHVWENPEVFDPERFHPSNTVNIPPFAYIPFAAGSRNCIGQHFGFSQMKVVLAQLLRDYELKWDPKTPDPIMYVGITVRPKDGLPLIVKRVKE